MMDHPYPTNTPADAGHPTFTPSMRASNNTSTQRSGNFKVGVNPWGGLWALSTDRAKGTQQRGTFLIGTNPYGGDPALRQEGK